MDERPMTKFLGRSRSRCPLFSRNSIRNVCQMVCAELWTWISTPCSRFAVELPLHYSTNVQHCCMGCGDFNIGAFGSWWFCGLCSRFQCISGGYESDLGERIGLDKVRRPQVVAGQFGVDAELQCSRSEPGTGHFGAGAEVQCEHRRSTHIPRSERPQMWLMYAAIETRSSSGDAPHLSFLYLFLPARHRPRHRLEGQPAVSLHRYPSILRDQDR